MSTPDREEPVLPEQSPGLPWPRSWRGLYWLVFGWFVLTVVLLAIFTLTFTG